MHCCHFKTMLFDRLAVMEQYSALRTNVSNWHEGKNISVSPCNFLPLSSSGVVTRLDGGLYPQKQLKLFSSLTVEMEMIERAH